VTLELNANYRNLEPQGRLGSNPSPGVEEVKKLITICIPQGCKAPDVGAELSSARNIKDKKVRDITLAGLNKIQHYI